MYFPLLSTNATPIHVQYNKTRYMLLIDHQCNSHNCSISQSKIYFFCLEMYPNSTINCKALICPFLTTNATPTYDRYHKPSCIVLLGNFFQLIYKIQSIGFPLVDHQCNPQLFNITKQAVFSRLGIHSN